MLPATMQLPPPTQKTCSTLQLPSCRLCLPRAVTAALPVAPDLASLPTWSRFRFSFVAPRPPPHPSFSAGAAAFGADEELWNPMSTRPGDNSPRRALLRWQPHPLDSHPRPRCRWAALSTPLLSAHCLARMCCTFCFADPLVSAESHPPRSPVPGAPMPHHHYPPAPPQDDPGPSRGIMRMTFSSGFFPYYFGCPCLCGKAGSGGHMCGGYKSSVQFQRWPANTEEDGAGGSLPERLRNVYTEQEYLQLQQKIERVYDSQWRMHTQKERNGGRSRCQQ